MQVRRASLDFAMVPGFNSGRRARNVAQWRASREYSRPFSQNRSRSVRLERRDSCPRSTTPRRKSPGRRQAIGDRRRRRPKLEAFLARSAPVFRRLWRWSRSATASNRSMYALASPAACRKLFQSRPRDGTEPGLRTAGSAGLDWALRSIRAHPRHPCRVTDGCPRQRGQAHIHVSAVLLSQASQV